MYRRELLCVAAGVAVAGCNAAPDDETPDPTDDDERVQLVHHVLVRDNVGTEEETVAVSGTLERLDEDDDISYVELRVRFLDEEGEALDTTTERVEELDPERDLWEFEVVAPFVGEQAAAVQDYEIEVGTVL